MNQKENTSTAPFAVPSVDATTIQLIIKGGILLAFACLACGMILGVFSLLNPEVAKENPVIVAATGSLLGVPNFAIGGLFAMLARTRTETPAPTGTPSDPVTVTPAEPISDSSSEQKKDTNANGIP